MGIPKPDRDPVTTGLKGFLALLNSQADRVPGNQIVYVVLAAAMFAGTPVVYIVSSSALLTAILACICLILAFLAYFARSVPAAAQSFEAGAALHLDGLTSVTGWSPRKLINECLSVRFAFNWGVGNLAHDSDVGLVYWPVKLRPPTPIHAVQAFVAGALGRAGAPVQLWIDDFGEQEQSFAQLETRLRQWYSSVRGSELGLEVKRCSESVGNDATTAWAFLKSWWGDTSDNLKQVLSVTKLWPTDVNGSVMVQDLQQQRPRKLLTPATVMMGLDAATRAHADSPVLTLGGADEEGLWATLSKSGGGFSNTQLSHLYVPAMTDAGSPSQALKMGGTNLAWTSRHDVRKFLAGAQAKAGPSWTRSGEAAPWCYWYVVLLHQVLLGTSPPRLFNEDRLGDLSSTHREPADVVSQLADAVASTLGY